MTERFDATPLDNTHDHELVGVDFHGPVHVMGAYATKEAVFPPVEDDIANKESPYIPYWGE